MRSPSSMPRLASPLDADAAVLVFSTVTGIVLGWVVYRQLKELPLWHSHKAGSSRPAPTPCAGRLHKQTGARGESK